MNIILKEQKLFTIKKNIYNECLKSKMGQTIYAPYIAEAKGKNCTFVTAESNTSSRTLCVYSCLGKIITFVKFELITMLIFSSKE